ncbi:MAG: spermidine/putrescine ABC transporter substrate-binding protein [Burkholderiales bacterium]|nr:spermidine/putrescine ABC transporter substrate-binding protein [Burkholderiales bacterium]
MSKMCLNKVALVFIFFMLTSFSWAEKKFNLYIGTNYIADPTIARFEKLCNCKLYQNYFNDNGELLAKIAAGASGYDVMVPTSYAVTDLIAMHKILPLDKSKLPNLQYVDKKFLSEPYDQGNKYSVPYAYNPVFLAYNVDKMKELGINPNTWAVVFDPKYLVKLKGRITMFNSSRNVFAVALLYLGKDPNSTNIADLKAAQNLINRASPYWAKFDSDSYYRGLLRGDIWVSQSYSIDIFKAMSDARNSHAKITIGAQLQKEGNMYELDNLVIPASTHNVNDAYAFINNALLPQSEYELSNLTGSSVPSQIAIKRLDNSIASLDWIYPHDMSKLQTFIAYPPKIRILTNEMWTEIQMQCREICSTCSYAQDN